MASVFAEGALEYADDAWWPAGGSPAKEIVPPGETSAVPVTAFALPGVVTISVPPEFRHPVRQTAAQLIHGDLTRFPGR
ncbi:hypothetical protein [Streptomyces sp. NPDC058240]|uniref:hypothetical protein n=1 Tax=Streptomyces sp. NPDC058240 TaxID=3346396 RepID=UPI0036E8D43A